MRTLSLDLSSARPFVLRNVEVTLVSVQMRTVNSSLHLRGLVMEMYGQALWVQMKSSSTLEGLLDSSVRFGGLLCEMTPLINRIPFFRLTLRLFHPNTA